MHAIAILLTSILLMVVTGSEGKVFSRCELARTLHRVYKFHSNTLGNWVCLIEAESGRNTRAVSRPNPNGSRDYGLFQVNSIYWCSGGPKSNYNQCKVSCAALSDDNITNDVRCARLIYRRHGYYAWEGWKSKCRGTYVQKYIAGCTL